ncbi:MAG: hypothetical protein AVDCRST_MAG02-1849, partial [uncultured Rubrobacteraceae bacterium]
ADLPQRLFAGQQASRVDLHGRRLHQRLLPARRAEPAVRRDRRLRPRLAHALEGEPARPDGGRDGRRGLGAARGRGDRRDPRRRRRLVPARAEALGGRHARSGDDLLRHPGRGRRVRGEGDRQGVPGGTTGRPVAAL